MEQFVARQPIFDRTKNVYGYELLFRSSMENFFSNRDVEQAASSVIADSLLSFGLDTLTGNRKGFFNCTRKVLVDETYSMLPRETAVVELLETVIPDADVLNACTTLKQSGYQLALDDFVYAPEFEPLLPLTDIVKVDMLSTDAGQRKEYAKRFMPLGVQLLAEKVETHEQFEEASALGYSYFQGYFFCKPQILSRKILSPSKLSSLHLLKEVQNTDIDFDRIETVIKHDVALSVRLLRFLNSASFGWRERVTSVKQALIILGEQQLRKWTAMVVLTSLGDDKPEELMITCLVRARFCEFLAPLAGLGNREMDLFFTGLLSALDALVDRPLAEILEELRVAHEIRSTLVGGLTPLSRVYRIAQLYEQANWDAIHMEATVGGIPEARIPDLYRRSVAWARTVLEPTE